MSSTKDHGVIRDHIEAAQAAFDKSDYFFMTIYSNRVLSDAMISNDINSGIAGFIIRIAAINYTAFSNQDPTKLETEYLSQARLPGTELLTHLGSLDLRGKNATENLWNLFLNFRNAFRKFEHDVREDEAYYEREIDILHTEASFKWLIDFLISSKEYLLFPSNNLFKGVINEAQRIGNLTGYVKGDILFLALLMSMDWLFDYTKSFLKMDTKLYQEKVKSAYFETINNLKDIIEDEGRTTKTVWEYLRKWREAFIVFMEINQDSKSKEGVIELPPEFRNKLSELMSQTLKRELK